MIKKERSRPLNLLKMEVLHRRLPPDHPSMVHIEQSLTRSRAGYKGELALDYHLSLLPHKKYLIFHDLRLESEDHFFQIDSILVCPSYLVILEVKNFSGILQFDPEFNQMTRYIDGKEEGFPDPLLQVERQQEQLYKWLKRKSLESLPIETLVVISYPSTIIRAPSTHSSQIIHSANLRKTMKKFEDRYQHEQFSTKDLRKLTTHLNKNNVPLDQDIFQLFQFQQKDLRLGVQCQSCSSIPMTRSRGYWFCHECKATSKDAHLEAVQDYALLVGSTITNRQLREFLQLPSQTIGKRILKSLDLKLSGTKKGCIYELPIRIS